MKEKEKKLKINDKAKQSLKNNKGITIITLAITIIVLAILAGVAISAAVGENGVIKRAQNSVGRHDKAQGEEVSFLNSIEDEYDKTISGNGGSGDIGGEVDPGTDTTPPEPFTIGVTNITTNGFTITGAETTDSGSGIAKYEYYVNGEDKRSNVVTGLSKGTYSVYVRAIDRAGNTRDSNTITVTIKEGISTEEQTELDKNGIEEMNPNDITNENLKDNENIKGVITGEVPIPEGFEYKEGTKETGVVITDRTSEFVWVPVENIDEMARKIGDGTDNYQGVLYDFSGTGDATVATEKTNYGIGTENNREPDVVTKYSNYDASTTNLKVINDILGTNYTSASQFKIDLQRDFNTMAESVKKYKGFYIGRYETSINLQTKTAYSKAGVIPATAEANSANMWYGFYAYQRQMATKNGYTSVESHMIWGSQYDAMLRWGLTGADKAKVNGTGNAAHDLRAVYETGKETVFGKKDRINNIYDLEGNGEEWMAEAANIDARMNRGGFYSFGISAAKRYSRSSSDDKDATLCSRITIYIK